MTAHCLRCGVWHLAAAFALLGAAACSPDKPVSPKDPCVGAAASADLTTLSTFEGTTIRGPQLGCVRLAADAEYILLPQFLGADLPYAYRTFLIGARGGPISSTPLVAASRAGAGTAVPQTAQEQLHATVRAAESRLRPDAQLLASRAVVAAVDPGPRQFSVLTSLVDASRFKVGLVNLAGPDSMHVRGDTILIDGLPRGEYQISLAHVAENCVVYGDNTARVRTLSLAPSGAAIVSFRLRCSERANRPDVISFESTYHDSTSGFVFRVADPDRDVQSYRWDLTDCQGNSVLQAPDRARVRRGLDADRTRGEDTLTIVGAFEVGIPDADLVGKCTSLLVEDFRGNTSDLIEQKIQPRRFGVAPAATFFDARLIGTTSLSTTLGARDNDGDFAGTFIAIRVRDGVLSASDGKPDIGIISPAGFLGTVIPNLALGGRIRWDDVYGVMAYLIDYNGNFTRLEDTVLF